MKKSGNTIWRLKLIDVEYTFDGNKILFYFTADGRIDFRELVKDACGSIPYKDRTSSDRCEGRDEDPRRHRNLRPAAVLQHISDRILGSIDQDGERTESIAEPDENISVCGRLMCCLTNEEETYEVLNSQLPSVGDTVTTKDGLTGTVQSLSVLRKLVKVVVNP